jgi:hypothetical protein
MPPIESDDPLAHSQTYFDHIECSRTCGWLPQPPRACHFAPFLAIKLFALDNSDEASANGATREGWFIHEQKNIDGSPSSAMVCGRKPNHSEIPCRPEVPSSARKCPGLDRRQICSGFPSEFQQWPGVFHLFIKLASASWDLLIPEYFRHRNLLSSKRRICHF